MNKLFNAFFMSLSMIGFVLMTSCSDDDSESPKPEARFVAVVSETDPFTVDFQNESENAISYAWDFGDGGTSEEENPSHTYTEEGTFTVTLTVTGTGGTDTRTREVEIVDTFKILRLLTGAESKTWKVVREGAAFRVGPIDDLSTTWWAFGINEAFANRPCILTDEYIFSFDGTLEYKTNGEFFADGEWDDDVQFACQEEDAPGVWINDDGVDISAWGSGVHSFELNVQNNTLAVIGTGAFLGMQKIGTTEEVVIPQESVEYEILKLEDVENGVDTLRVRATHPGERVWDITLVHYDNPSDEPPIPVSPPTTVFTFDVSSLTATFTNSSTGAESFIWDFGDGTTSTETSPSHTYAELGVYDAKLTATNSGGSTEQKARIIVGASTLAAADLHNGSSRTWTLSERSGAIGVAPEIGQIIWWGNDDAWAANAPCLFDDEFVFHSDGTLEYNANSDVWTEGFMTGIEADGCIDEASLPSNLAEWASDTYSYSFTAATGTDNATITATGNGAFLGLYKGANGKELQEPEDGSIVYDVFGFIDGPTTDYLVITVDYSADQDGSSWWTYILESN